MCHGQCWKGRMGEEARRKPTHDQPPSFWVFLCLNVSVSLTVSGEENLRKKLHNLLPSTQTPTTTLCSQITPHPHTCLTLRFWHTERISSQAFSRLFVKA